MDRINGAGHVNRLFVAEDVAQSRPPTEITETWLNGVQEELVGLILYAGLALNSADNTQLKQAVLALISANSVAAASENVSGKVELATSAETLTGDDTVRATHPAGVKAAIQSAIATLVNSSPAALDTLKELAAALGNDANFATTMTNALAGKQPLDATLTALAGVVVAADKLIYSTGADAFATTTLSAFIRTLLDDGDATTARSTLGLGTSATLDAGVPPNGQPASYVLALADNGKSIDFTGAAGQSITIPANASVAFPVGAAVTITNTTANNLSIAITTDTLRQAGTANTGTRTLAQYGVATARKVSATVWIISGAGLS